MRKLLRILIVIVLLFVCMVFLYYRIRRYFPIPRVDSVHYKIDRHVEKLKHRLGIMGGNIERESVPVRKKPLSTALPETKLRSAFSAPGIKNPFAEFTRKDWNRFWNAFYGYKEEEDSFTGAIIKRQRTKKEVEEYLKVHYSNPFYSFQEEHWSWFWNNIIESWKEPEKWK